MYYVTIKEGVRKTKANFWDRGDSLKYATENKNKNNKVTFKFVPV